MENGYSYGMNLLIWADQGLNSVLAGSCDETLSSRTYRMARIAEDNCDVRSLWLDFERLVDFVFFLDKGKNGERHCELAYLVEMRGGHMPKAMTRACLLR